MLKYLNFSLNKMVTQKKWKLKAPINLLFILLIKQSLYQPLF